MHLPCLLEPDFYRGRNGVAACKQESMCRHLAGANPEHPLLPVLAEHEWTEQAEFSQQTCELNKGFLSCCVLWLLSCDISTGM